jgi:hypothetical protein
VRTPFLSAQLALGYCQFAIIASVLADKVAARRGHTTIGAVWRAALSARQLKFAVAWAVRLPRPSRISCVDSDTVFVAWG